MRLKSKLMEAAGIVRLIVVVTMKGVPHPEAASDVPDGLPATPVITALRRFVRHQNVRTLGANARNHSGKIDVL